ncbi:radical SAM protein [Desulfovirgula thermocuniculi]|uniref:radical SAM protein n=1 Tax=Desulfovirgula thermocuniculi TaxID=348842 RepID=UPI00041E3B76|nr:radical SAM protein [Desulfovirgula thermocuniculi]
MAILCAKCGNNPAAEALVFCGKCLKENLPEAEPIYRAAHRKSRRPLPEEPPAGSGVACRGCANYCRLGEGERGFCGLRQNRHGRLVHLAGTPRRGLAVWYHDPLPTNCVASWVCPAGSSSGYPQYSYSPAEETGYYNLAVFLGGCSYDCLFCQNRDYHRLATKLQPLATAEELAAAVTPQTACICFFGGDPSPQMPFALKSARLALQAAGKRILRICWETNGNISPRHLKTLAELSLATGGCVKFDLKAYDEGLHRSLTGVTNKHTLANFASLAGYFARRPDPPFLVASTLLIPGYVDSHEVGAIARFIAGLNPDIPYALLAFYPRHLMADLPFLSREEAERCLEAALAAGLRRVTIGNVHLLK